MKSVVDPHAGATVTGLFLGSLAIAGAVAFVTAPITPRLAVAQEAGSSERPTARGAPLVTQAAKGRTAARSLLGN